MLVSITWILELRLNLQAWFASDFCRLCSCFSALLRSGACHRQFGLRNPLSKHLCDSKVADVVDVRVGFEHKSVAPTTNHSLLRAFWSCSVFKVPHKITHNPSNRETDTGEELVAYSKARKDAHAQLRVELTYLLVAQPGVSSCD